MPIYSELRGKIVVITGGANGIGAAMVRAFHAQMAQVIFCDVDVVAGRRLARELGSNVQFHKVDLREEPQIDRWIARIGDRFKAVHVLINNAAADPRIALQKTSAKAWDELFARNLRAFFLTCRAASQWM